MASITMNDLVVDQNLDSSAMQSVRGGWYYNPYYLAGYGGLGLGWANSFSGYGGYNSMNSWVYRQGVSDSSHDSFISSIWT
jgi:hypothetical protein